MIVKIGEKYDTNKCSKVDIILYNGWKKVIVLFSDGTEVNVQAGNLLKMYTIL